MASHSFNLQLPRPSDHFVTGGRQVFIGCGLSQDGRADEQVYRVRKRQGRLLRVSLVAQLDAKSGSQKAGMPVAADGVEGRFTSEVGGTLQAIGGTSRDVAHSPLPEGVDDGDSQPFGFRGSVGDAAQRFQGQDDAGNKPLFVGALPRLVWLTDPLCFFTHGRLSSSFRHEHFVSQVRQ